MSPPEAAVAHDPVSAAIRADATGLRLLAVRYDVRDQNGRRRSTVDRAQAAAGIKSGAYRPVGRNTVKHLRVVREDGGGDLRCPDANLTTVRERDKVVGFHGRSKTFKGVIEPLRPPRR
jgi:hypothetical protein